VIDPSKPIEGDDPSSRLGQHGSIQSLDIPLMRVEQVSLAAKAAGQAASALIYLLQDVSFQVFPGDRISLIGASGAGKTSLLRLLNRLSEPTSGKIYLEQDDIRQIPVTQLRQQVTLVLQESKLLGMTVQEAIVYPLKLRGLPKSTIQQRLQECLEQLHMPTEWLERTEVQLSVGQRQLVSLARALVIQPKVLLLDEPTSALDAGRGDNILKVLTQVASTRQIAILMANHQLDLAQAFASRVLHLHQGRLIQNVEVAQVNWMGVREVLAQADKQTGQDW